jgi:hypothetical protein
MRVQIVLFLVVLAFGSKVNASVADSVDGSLKQMICPVFEISPVSIVVMLPTSEIGDSGIFDSIFGDFEQFDSNLSYYLDQQTVKNGIIYDSTGAYKLFRNDKLERETKKLLAKNYFIYGTKACVRCKVKDIVFAFDECRSQIYGFTIEGYDAKRCGHPLMCIQDSLPVSYGNDYAKIEQRVNNFEKPQPGDYIDSIRSKIFGNIGTEYFTYHDDFNWARESVGENTKCYWPGRAILRVLKNRKPKILWGAALDLFGIPCD